ncbi:MAG: putative oxidoreductase C-terminal domain-containing protein [Betaproteobacteria bacterium]
MQLTVLDPGHFHAALLQKKDYPDVDRLVRVYAPAGPDLDDYLHKIAGYNARAQAPTHWQVEAHTSADYFERFLADRPGSMAVIAGNNRRKTEYIARAISVGMHVLADKPMVIDRTGFDMLPWVFIEAAKKEVLLYDIMTERHEITTMLQKSFSQMPAVFGQLSTGTLADPAVTKESIHHFSKMVSGAPIKRPAWFFDVTQQGEGLVDITTHLVDLVQWECFPDRIIDYHTDIEVISAWRWPTMLTREQFAHVTTLTDFPPFLQSSVGADGNLQVYANGEINYRINDVHAKVSVRWNFEAEAGAGDSHFSVMRGTRTNLVIRQGAAEAHQPTLTIEPVPGIARADLQRALQQAMPLIQENYPGVSVEPAGDGWKVIVPAVFHVGHEAHFGQVVDQFLGYVKAGKLPDWEVPNMLAKYWTTTNALASARTAP